MKEKERYKEMKIRVTERKQEERGWIKTEKEETDKPRSPLNTFYICALLWFQFHRIRFIVYTSLGCEARRFVQRKS
jgi:hypothetical protein